MIRTKQNPIAETAERKAIVRRIRRMFDWFNREMWEKCFAMIDPRLRESSKVSFPTYADQMQSFKNVYGSILPWHLRVSLHLDASANKQDGRPFAFVYVVWQDAAKEYHMFRERWVKDEGRWYTRVVGLVPNKRLSNDR